MIEKFIRRYNAFKLAYLEYQTLKNRPNELQWRLIELPKLKEFENKHLGEDCFIICNGPSLNKTDLTLLKNHYTIGLNKIYLIFEKYKLDLDYLVAVNTLVIEQSIDYFKKMGCPVFLSNHLNLELKTNNIHILKTNGNFNFTTKLENEISEGYTVTYVALQLAYIMGFKNIFLIGADHYFKQEGNPNSEQLLNGDDLNHFHPDYFKGQKWHLADIEGNEISYKIANKKYLENGRKIYNSTIGGHLEIFERIEFQQALRIAKPRNG